MKGGDKMKKNLILVSVFVMTILCLSLVSAFWPFDGRGITGNAIAEYTEDETTYSYPECFGDATYSDSEDGYMKKEKNIAGGILIKNPCESSGCFGFGRCSRDYIGDQSAKLDACQDDGKLREYFVESRDVIFNRIGKTLRYEDMDCDLNYECRNTGEVTIDGVAYTEVEVCVEKSAALACQKTGSTVTANDIYGNAITYNHGWSNNDREPVDGCLNDDPRRDQIDDPNDGFANEVIHIGANLDGTSFISTTKVVFGCSNTDEVTMTKETCARGCVDGKCEASQSSCTETTTGITFTDFDGESKTKENTCSNSNGRNVGTTGTHVKTFSCNNDERNSATITECTNGCSNAACIGVTCSDSDDMNNIASLSQNNYAGELAYQIHQKSETVIGGGSNTLYRYTDHCIGENVVLEYWCPSATSILMGAGSFTCPTGQTCSDGKCTGVSGYPFSQTNIIPAAGEPQADCGGLVTNCYEKDNVARCLSNWQAGGGTTMSNAIACATHWVRSTVPTAAEREELNGVVACYNANVVGVTDDAISACLAAVDLEEADACALLGDVDGDGDISCEDVAKIFAYYMDSSAVSGLFNENCADVNGDGEITTPGDSQSLIDSANLDCDDDPEAGECIYNSACNPGYECSASKNCVMIPDCSANKACTGANQMCLDRKCVTKDYPKSGLNYDITFNTGIFTRTGSVPMGNEYGVSGRGIQSRADSYISFSDRDEYDQPQMTISAWVKFTETAPTQITKPYKIVSKIDWTSSQKNGFQLWFDPIKNGDLSFSILDGTHMTNATYSSTRFAKNVWYHIAGSYDGQHVRVYVDGVQREKVAMSEGSEFVPSSGRLTIGRNFVGNIDEVKMYSRLLRTRTRDGTNEIKQLWLSQKP